MRRNWKALKVEDMKVLEAGKERGNDIIIF